MTATVTQLYSAGYEGMDHATFIATVQARDFMVMDVRFTPSSRNPDWSRSRLSKALGERYVHVPELGNRNYRGDMGSGIIIANADVGLARLALELSRKSVVQGGGVCDLPPMTRRPSACRAPGTRGTG